MIEEKIEVMGRYGSRCKQLPDDLKETWQYWKLKEEALDGTIWKTCFGRGYGPVVIERLCGGSDDDDEEDEEEEGGKGRGGEGGEEGGGGGGGE